MAKLGRSLYCSQNQAEFRKWLAAHICTHYLGNTKTAALIGLMLTAATYLNQHKYGPHAALPYIATILISLIFWLGHLALGFRVYKIAFLAHALWSVSFILGVCYIIKIARDVNDPLLNTPVQIGLILCWFMTHFPKFWYNVVFNIILTAIMYFILSTIDAVYLSKITMQFLVAVFFGAAVNYFMHITHENSFYVEATERVSLLHAYTEMKKLLYPHQLELIQSGHTLEETMPVGTSKACVVSLDIVDSSNIHHERFPAARDLAFSQCFEESMKGYTHVPLKSEAFWLKNVGDGFICTVGFPFGASIEQTLATSSVELAERFHEIFLMNMKKLDYPKNICCSIGIGFGELKGFFSKNTVNRYDLDGRAIILATRYESLRKLMFSDVLNKSIMIIPTNLWENLSQSKRSEFTYWDAKGNKMPIRDDPEADGAYFKFLGMKNDSLANFQSAV